MIFDVGRIVVKVAGRDARKKAVVVDVFDKTYVLIDGQTRRRKCNVLHLEPLNQVVSLHKGASHEQVVKALASVGIECAEPSQKAPKDKSAKKARPLKKHKKKAKRAQTKTPKKAAAKQEAKAAPAASAKPAAKPKAPAQEE